MRRGAIAVAALGLMLLSSQAAHAVRPDEMLANPALERRAREISQELRCLVCQNESIDESNADLAHDLRVLVRQRLVAGDTDRQVVAYIVARYGDFVLLKPPFKAKTLVLWLAPGLILAAGGAGVWLMRRRAVSPEAAPLSDEERARLASLLAEGPDA